ncbi:serine/threonine-protein kinase [Rhodobacteraceae bacterium]|nr:serine/threonine-protein kinase [Paracoccaceae bacterium]
MIEPLPSDMFVAGDILNNTYEVEGVLGRGGTGEVYRVVNKVTGRIFAIKVLNAQFSGNEDYVELMKREEEMRNIIHDSVVRYNECSRTDSGNVILVMDYIAGQSLADAMVERQVSEKELLIIAHRIAEGLVAAHGHGMVHRDLSPDNIILRDGEAGKATLIDFGIAKDTTEGARTIVGNDFAGKYEYAAPEQIDGKAEAKSDLYGLGATLLAAYRGETPFLGTTPGEIVRRKQGRLDTEGVSEQLRGVIDVLSDPDPAMRPESAAAAVRLLEDVLEDRQPKRGKGARARRTKAGKGRRSGVPVVMIGLVILALGAAGYLLRGVIFGPSLEVVTPYTLSASKGIAGRTMLMGHAPDEASSEALVLAFVGATGALPEAATVTLADGVPGPEWTVDITGLLDLTAGLQRWQLEVSGETVRLSGLAPNSESLARVRTALQSWQAGAGVSLDQDLQAGPEVLTASALAGVLDEQRSCGALNVDGDQFDLGARVPITGNVASAEDATRIETALKALIGSRTVDLDVYVLNPDLCAIRNILPVTQLGDMSVWLGKGADGASNLTGVFSTGENPVVDILVPANQIDAFLWVMVVDNTGKVFHVLPNINNTEQRVSQLGEIEGGVRRIPVLHPRSVLASDPNKLVMEVTEGDFGKSEVVALLSKKPLFDIRRPRDESTESAKEALTDALASSENDLISVSTRIIEARR